MNCCPEPLPSTRLRPTTLLCTLTRCYYASFKAHFRLNIGFWKGRDSARVLTPFHRRFYYCNLDFRFHSRVGTWVLSYVISVLFEFCLDTSFVSDIRLIAQNNTMTLLFVSVPSFIVMFTRIVVFIQIGSSGMILYSWNRKIVVLTGSNIYLPSQISQYFFHYWSLNITLFYFVYLISVWIYTDIEMNLHQASVR